MMMKKTICMLLSVLFGLAGISQSNKSQATGSKDSVDLNLAPVYDLDSNRYTVVKIGKQYWMQQNLRTTKYNDTGAIATGLSASEWKETKKGAFALYENNSANDPVYGKLYNGYAVATGKLCPKGWHIPTDKEWKELEAFIGVEQDRGKEQCGRSVESQGILEGFRSNC
jgi:uncharacterized protein (TIGR02145 family)